jgi:NADH-quinone oxidoreductase subunit H
MTLPEFITPQFIASMVTIFVILHLMLGAAAYLILLERKICAWSQDRCGPNRVGPAGLLQPIADGVKLFFKEDFIPTGADKTLFIMAPALAAMIAIISFVVLPWAGTLDLTTLGPLTGLLGVDMLPESEQTVQIMGATVNIGIVYLIAVTSLGVYGVVLGGWATNNKYSFLGGLRASAQMVSYEIPMGLCLLCVILTAGTVRPDEMVGQQAAGQWNIIHQPLAAILFYVCLLAEANRAPFDLAEAEAELVGGWHTEYSSMKWTLFFLAEYIHLQVGAAFFVVLFLGGWSINPIGGWDPIANSSHILAILLQVGVVLGKIFALICLTMMVRWTLPRFRFDQLMRLAWEGMIPASLVILLTTSVFVFMGWMSYMWIGSLIAFAIIWIATPMLPRPHQPNHRIGLIGSRFSSSAP